MTQRSAGGGSARSVRGLLVLALLPTGLLFAQSRPQNNVSAPAAQKPGLSFFVSTEGAFESNPTFDAPPNDVSDFSGSGGGGFDYSGGGARTSINFSGESHALFYRELTDLNTITYGGNLAATYRPGPKTNLAFNGSVNYDYARRSELLTSEGIVLPQTQVLTMRFGAGISHALAAKTTLAIQGRFEQAKFDGDTLRDGQTLGGTASLSHQVSRKTALSFGYAYDRTDSDVQTQNIHTGYAGAHFVMSPRTDLDLKAGAQAFPALAGGWNVEPYGDATFNLRYPRLVMSLAYTHEIRQEYGTGRVRRTDLGSLGFNRSFGGRRPTVFNMTLSYGFNQSTFAALDRLDYQTLGAVTSLHVPIARSLRADGGYSYFRSTERTPDVDSHTVFVAFSYRFEPH